MITRLANGTLWDPTRNLEGARGDLHIEDGRIVAAPASDAPMQTIDLAGRVVMAGAIDIHSHIAGGKVTLGRLLLPEEHRTYRQPARGLFRSGSGRATLSSFSTGYRYAAMGYTAAFEPAMVAANARQAHLEMADVPMIDKGAYVMLGNDDFLLKLIAERASQSTINDYVGWMMTATQALAVKVVNPAGINAFKFSARSLGLDEPGPHWGVTPRAVLQHLARAVHALDIRHPLHVHCNDLGVPGNVATTLATMEAAEGLPIHLTHIQFHSYGKEGKRGFSSGAAAIAEAVNRLKNVSVDVGQVMFGRTITASGDTMAQYRNRTHADPAKWIIMDIECDGGCGLVPFNYRDRNFVNALQWAIGLELFLMVEDPNRIFLTTDHPNGAPFDVYPELIRLLMDEPFRKEALGRIHKGAAAASALGGLARAYTMAEIATMTRSAPAAVLGLAGRGTLAPGAAADIAVYEDAADRQLMFGRPHLVFKDGVLVAREGTVVAPAWGRTYVARPAFDGGIEKSLGDFFARHSTIALESFRLSEADVPGGILVAEPGARRAS